MSTYCIQLLCILVLIQVHTNRSFMCFHSQEVRGPSSFIWKTLRCFYTLDINSNSLLMMTISSAYKKNNSEDVLRRNKEESYWLWTRENCSIVDKVNQTLGACFNQYKDFFSLHTAEVGEENRQGGDMLQRGYIVMGSWRPDVMTRC